MKTRDNNGAALALAAVTALALGGLARSRQGAPWAAEGSRARRRGQPEPERMSSDVVQEAEELVTLVRDAEREALSILKEGSPHLRLPDVIAQVLRAQGHNNLIGWGRTRMVFVSQVDPTLVIKVDIDQGYSNQSEAESYLLAGPKTKKILVPVLVSDPDGRWLIMKRVSMAKDHKTVAKLGLRAHRLLGWSGFDLHQGNVSADGRLLDYGDVFPGRLEGSPARMTPGGSAQAGPDALPRPRVKAEARALAQRVAELDKAGNLVMGLWQDPDVDFLGAGADRCVFRSRVDPSVVIKVDLHDGEINLREAAAYRDAGPKTKALLVPVRDIAPDGRWLIMDYAEPTRDPYLAVEARVAARELGLRFNDLHAGNVARSGQILDYGEQIDGLQGSPARMGVAHGARRGSPAKPWASGHGEARRRERGPSAPAFRFEIYGKDTPTAWILESEARPAVIGHLQASRVERPLADDGGLNKGCKDDVRQLRRELGDKSAPVFYVWRSQIEKEHRNLGYGTQLYLFTLEMLKQQEGRDVILIPEACAMGSTSDQALRVWAALQSRQVSCGVAASSRPKPRGSAADAKLRGGVGWHGTPAKEKLVASGTVRASTLTQRVRSLREVADGLRAHPGPDGALARETLLCNRWEGGLIPLEGHSYLARRKPRAEDYGEPVRVRPKDKDAAVADEDWLAWQLGSILGLLLLPGDPPAAKYTDRVRFKRPEDTDAAQAAAQLRGAAREVWGADRLDRMRQELMDVMHLARGQPWTMSMGGQGFIPGRPSNVFFCALTVAAKELIAEAGSTAARQRWMDEMTLLSPTLAYRGELEVVP
jgi:hypothetical protein